ncbi:RAB7A-interacting MON1-CCZ1 complex subunit 1 [Dendrobates tinctorius]|uniref:RAB7A-interacting MON1-CCZ1 complex subunit 1 n=1 Tax=Dendrobates tinctorius TaxID=92724 RepID=UPI003CCA4BA7
MTPPLSSRDSLLWSCDPAVTMASSCCCSEYRGRVGRLRRRLERLQDWGGDDASLLKAIAALQKLSDRCEETALTAGRAECPALTAGRAECPTLTAGRAECPALTAGRAECPALTAGRAECPALTAGRAECPALTAGRAECPALTAGRAECPALTAGRAECPALTAGRAECPALTAGRAECPALTAGRAECPALTAGRAECPALTAGRAECPALTACRAECPALTAGRAECPLTAGRAECPTLTAGRAECPTLNADHAALSADCTECPALNADLAVCPALNADHTECPALNTECQDLNVDHAEFLASYTQALLDVTYCEENRLVEAGFPGDDSLQTVRELVQLLSEPERLSQDVVLDIEVQECLHWRRGALLYMYCHTVGERERWELRHPRTFHQCLQDGVHYLLKMLQMRSPVQLDDKVSFRDINTAALLEKGVFSDVHVLALMYCGEMCYWAQRYCRDAEQTSQRIANPEAPSQDLQFRDIGEKVLDMYVGVCEGPLREQGWSTDNAKKILQYLKGDE